VPTYFGPGRVNLIGEHTDYAGGLALPVAIDRGITLEVTGRRGHTHLSSDGFDDLDLAPSQGSATGWGRFVLAVAGELARAGLPVHGLQGRMRSNLPVEAGLSSSAALEVTVALGFLGDGDQRLDDEHLIRLCRDAEERAVGVPCGLLDQAAVVLGRGGHAVFLSFPDLAHEYLPWPAKLAIVVLHSGLTRNLEDTSYAARRDELRRGLEGSADPMARRRARHFHTENDRVRELVELLRVPAGDPRAIGHVLLAGHASLRDDFEVSTPELDRLVALAVDHGAYGARLTGAGFGGAVLALADAARAAEMSARTIQAYREWMPTLPASTMIVTPSDKARRIDVT
jgi:galactokinase